MSQGANLWVFGSVAVVLTVLGTANKDIREGFRDLCCELQGANKQHEPFSTSICGL